MYLWMNSPLNFILEETFAKGTAFVDHLFTSTDDLPYNLNDVMFIDVSQSNALVKDESGNHVTADRQKLDTLFQLFHEYVNPNRIIVCDLYFDRHSPQDSSFQAAVDGLPNVLTAIKSTSDQEIIPNVIKAGTFGISGFRNIKEPFLIFSNSLSKFNLTDKNRLKTLPLLLFEKVNHQTTSCLGDALHIGDDWYSNSILIKEQVEQNVSRAVLEDQILPIERLIKDIKQHKDDNLSDFKHKKFIIIGDFEKDVHHTTFGDKAGPLILFNVFLSLQQNENKISTWWVLCAVTFFTWLTYKKFYHVNLSEGYNRTLNRTTKSLGFKRPLEFNWLIFYGFVLFSSVVFHVYMELVAGVLFFNLLVLARIYVKTRRLKWKQLQKSRKKIGIATLLSLLFRKPGFKN